MMSTTQTLVDADAIREWAQAHGAAPARTSGDESSGGGRLTFDFHVAGRDVEPLTWEDWLDRFNRLGLALLIEHNTGDATPSCQLVRRSPQRPRLGAARRRRNAPGGNQPIGGRRGRAAAPAARRRQPMEDRESQEKGRGRRRSKNRATTRRSESRGRSKGQKSGASPRKSAGKSGRARRK
jgi:hypothetical protein